MLEIAGRLAEGTTRGATYLRGRVGGGKGLQSGTTTQNVEQKTSRVPRDGEQRPLKQTKSRLNDL